MTKDLQAPLASCLRSLPAALVAAAAAVVTAHGLVEVVVAAHVQEPLAWAYPLITDGLALVAYRATSRLDGAGRRYAWTVVVIAAAVSGAAQAAYLASGALPEAPSWLRAGVGAWPAIAAAVAAHLLHLLAEPPAVPSAVVPSGGTAPDQPEQVRTRFPEPAPEADAVEPLTDAADTASNELDPRVRALAADLEDGHDITGEQVGERFGVSPRTGRRLLGDARAHLEAAVPRADPGARPTTGLHLVEGTSTA